MEGLRNNAEGYRVNLGVFEGPLDLLLHLIRKNDLEITDIPISMITEEYLKYLDAMNELNVNVAGEYLLMAAELVQIKSKMLLPAEGVGDDEEQGPDPREDLQRRLLEYQRYKEAAEKLANCSILYRDEFLQLDPERISGRTEVVAEENVFRLLEAFQFLARRIPDDRVREITIDRLSVNERLFELIDIIREKETVSIEELLPAGFHRYDLVVTFLALLEMAKLVMIRIFQAGQFQTIYITGTLKGVSAEEALRLVSEEAEEKWKEKS